MMRRLVGFDEKIHRRERKQKQNNRVAHRLSAPFPFQEGAFLIVLLFRCVNLIFKIVMIEKITVLIDKKILKKTEVSLWQKNQN